MYAVIRRYNIAPGSADTIVQRVNEQFLPSVSQAPGFVAYYVVDPGDGTIASVSIFDDRAGADASTRLATEWVRQSVGSAIKTAPVIITGQVVAQSAAGAAASRT
jgi:heme-degrading monooxygenase HmoA